MDRGAGENKNKLHDMDPDRHVNMDRLVKGLELDERNKALRGCDRLLTGADPFDYHTFPFPST